jgi:Lrp/AsnC family transcriptional regulator for asnA, asnC and gidA
MKTNTCSSSSGTDSSDGKLALSPSLRACSVAVALGDYDEVGYLAATTGRFNLSAAISVASQADLLDFCENAVGKLQGVRRVEPWVILRMYKAFGTPTTALIEAAERAGKPTE